MNKPEIELKTLKQKHAKEGTRDGYNIIIILGTNRDEDGQYWFVNHVPESGSRYDSVGADFYYDASSALKAFTGA